MKYIKAFLVGGIGLFTFITLFSLLIPSHPKVSRTVVINNASSKKVTAQVADLTNWKNWHPFFSSDSVTVSFGKTSTGEGGSCDILYNNKTTHLIITKVDTVSVTIDLSAKGENTITNQIFITDIPNQQTRVDWMATTHLHWYPWEKFYAIFVDKLTGPGYEIALNGLKQFIESQ